MQIWQSMYPRMSVLARMGGDSAPPRTSLYRHRPDSAVLAEPERVSDAAYEAARMRPWPVERLHELAPPLCVHIHGCVRCEDLVNVCRTVDVLSADPCMEEKSHFLRDDSN